MTVGISITFRWHVAWLVDERAQYHKNGDFSLAGVTSNIFIAAIAMQQCLTDFVFST